MLKRVFDFSAAFVGLAVTAPLIAALIVAVRLDTPGPGLFRQTRIGKDRKPFTIYKLRTMYDGTAQRATHAVSRSAQTRLGQILRRTKLDELPQLYNVIRGDMSLVGPRPCLATQDELIAEREARGVYGLRPGITGLAQAAGIDMSQPKRLAYVDEIYLKNSSFIGDIALILKSVGFKPAQRSSTAQPPKSA